MLADIIIGWNVLRWIVAALIIVSVVFGPDLADALERWLHGDE